MNIKPLNHHVLIKPAPAETTTESGIVLPDSSAEKPQQGEVVAVPIRGAIVNTGDTVIFGKYAGTELAVGDDNLLVVRESDLIAVLD